VVGVVASVRYRLSPPPILEGTNNRIRVMRQMAYGYRGNDYFFLKVRAAFPGKAR